MSKLPTDATSQTEIQRPEDRIEQARQHRAADEEDEAEKAERTGVADEL